MDYRVIFQKKLIFIPYTLLRNQQDIKPWKNVSVIHDDSFNKQKP